MTERFEVPEPSEGAVLEFNAAWNNPHLRQTDWLLRAFQADVPRIVRAEVERFGEWCRANACVPTVHSQARYVRARFGEAAPERCECWDDTPERTECPRHPWHPSTPSAPAGRVFIPHMGGGQYVNEFTQADRDRLARMERFLTALARIHEVASPGDSRVTNVRVAAREYLR